MRARLLLGLVAAAAAAGCARGVSQMKDNLPTCITVAACDAHDGKRVIVVGIYQHFPDQPGVEDTGVPRAVRIVLGDGAGPLLEPYWHKEAVRPEAEVKQYLGRKVRVTGVYHREQPRNPDDPPYASAVGGSCLHPVEAIEPAE
jgi:hypothetical protein